MITLLDIQRMSSEDGPGLRTTAFFKGCSLACAWCHNPESISAKREVLWHKARCIGCLSCAHECPENALEAKEEGLWRNEASCKGQDCLHCAARCPTGAMEVKGSSITPEELVSELVKDKAYWGASGGVTLSGGEALAQAECATAARLLKEQGVQVALDTCGQASTARLKEILEHVDTVLYDLKLADAAEHEKWTGSTNETVLKNLEEVVNWAQEDPSTRTLWIRTPLIPKATDSAENIKQLAGILQAIPHAARAITRWELCAFNNLCLSKYQSAQKTWSFEGVPLTSKEHAEELKALAEQSLIQDIRITGATS